MRRSNKSMRKQLKALLITVALVTLSTGLIGCNNEKKQQQTTTQVETTENKVENNIEFKSDGEPVKDDSVLGKNTYVFSPTDNKDEIQKKASQIFARQESNQFEMKDMHTF